MSHPQNVTKPIEITPRCNILEDIHNLIYIYIQYNDFFLFCVKRCVCKICLARVSVRTQRARRHQGHPKGFVRLQSALGGHIFQSRGSACSSQWGACGVRGHTKDSPKYENVKNIALQDSGTY